MTTMERTLLFDWSDSIVGIQTIVGPYPPPNTVILDLENANSGAPVGSRRSASTCHYFKTACGNRNAFFRTFDTPFPHSKER